VNTIQLIYKVNQFIVNPLILLLMAVAMVVFFWGVFEFVSKSGSDEARDRGKKNMLWGIVGLFIMVAAFGIIQIILGTFGITPPPEIIP
jgi:hypothetical protein